MTAIASIAQPTTTSANTATAAAGAASTTLGNNYQTFLKLLMTQLQNQDPTSPLDTNQFTQQLVQYSSVEQQIATNTNLGTLISLSQSNAVLQSAGLVGHEVTFTSDQLSLQSGQASLHLNAATAGKATITIADANNKVVSNSRIDVARGNTDYQWTPTGLPDGAYKVTVTDADGNSLPFTTTATATSVSQSNNTTTLSLGALSIPFSAITTVAK